MTAPNVDFNLTGKRVWVAGHRGLLGQALLRRLAQEQCEILTVDRRDVDLRRQAETEAWISEARPDAIFLAAGHVGGIHANSTYPAEFLYDNLTIETNVIEGARRLGVRKLLLPGSSCIYPREANQPMREDALLTGPLEPTNEPYAIAKIAGIKLCQAYRRQYGCDFITAMPTNLYGPGDNFDPDNSHVIAGLIRRIDAAKHANGAHVDVWGTGTARREFLFVDDCADALVFLMRRYSDDAPINVGSGRDVTIRELAETLKDVIGFQGELRFDPSKPDGTPRKLLDVSRLGAMGWRAKTELADGLRAAYVWYADNRGLA